MLLFPNKKIHVIKSYNSTIDVTQHISLTIGLLILENMRIKNMYLGNNKIKYN